MEMIANICAHTYFPGSVTFLILNKLWVNKVSFAEI